MKALFKTILFSIICASTAFAQGSLQFNQVKLVSTTETVPSGKVWKITNILPSARLTSAAGGTTTAVSESTTHEILVDGGAIIVASSNSEYSVGTIGMSERGGSTAGSGTRPYAAATSSAWSILNGAIWLPAGTDLAASTGVSRVSVIEFNIVP